MDDSCVFNTIKTYIDMIHNNQNELTINNITLNSPSYMISQLVRHISTKHWYISQKASDLWDKLSKDDIWKYAYTNSVNYDFTEPITLPQYVGASKTPRSYLNLPQEKKSKNKFIFREVFHDEHITDIKSIVNKLLSMSDTELTEENVTNLLNGVSIARILKDENNLLSKSYNRGITYDKTIHYYNEAGIILIPKEVYIEQRNIKLKINN